MEILIPVLIVTVIGIAAGVILSLSAKFFSVPTNPKIEQVRDALPGANCGGCGYSGCDGYAEALVNGADITLCSAGGADTGIHDGNIDGALGPELQALIQTVAGAPGVVLGDLVGAVKDLQLPVYGLDNAVHGADSTFCVSKVGLEDQNGLIKHTHSK